MQTETILLVDDEELERIYLKQAIEQSTNTLRVIGEAGNGREAIELAFKLLPNYILMDIRMPGINGLDAIKEIKSLHPEIICIIITAYEEFSYAQKALRIGAEEYLLKPVSPEEVLSVIEVLKKEKKCWGNKSLLGKEPSFDKFPLAKLNKIQDILSLNSLDEAKKYLENYNNEIIEFINYDNQEIKGLADNILKYIKRNISENNMCLEKLAQHFHFSPNYISRIIKKETGLTFSEHLNQIRVNEAKILLTTSEININQIAFLVGYNEVPHFNRMFKRIIGISPSKYRNLFS